MTSEPPLEARLFGAPELSWRGERVDPRSRKGLLLLVRALADPAGVSRHEACELLWGPGRYGNLRQQLYLLRRLPGAGHWLLHGDPIRVRGDSDLNRFFAAAEEGRHLDALHQAGADRMPLARWPTVLDGFDASGTPAFAEWLTLLRERADMVLQEVLRARADELERLGQSAPALAALRTLLDHDPLDEAAHRGIMRLEFGRGRLQVALAQFESCRRVLRNELGFEPMQETVELARVIEDRSRTPSRAGRPPRLPTLLLRPPTLVGRDREWDLMEEAWSEGKTIFLTGPSGIGKTRLMMDFVRTKGRHLLLEGYPGDHAIPYSVSVRALDRILAQVPELTIAAADRRRFARIAPHLFPRVRPDAGAGDAPMRAAATMETFLRLMLRLRSCVDALPADDIQYYDRFTEELGFRITAEFAEQGKSPGAGTMAAFRRDEISSSQWAGITSSVAAGMAVLIELQPLNQDEVAVVLASLDMPDDAATVDRLHRYTGGNPMYLVETLKALYVADGPAGARLSPLTAPHRAAAVIEARLATLPGDALSLLRAAAIESREVEVPLVQRMLDLPHERMLAALEAAENAGWIRDGRFVHDVVQEVVLGTTPRSVQRFLHRRAAEVQEEQGASHGRIARHYDAAGDDSRAAARWQLAGERHFDEGLYRDAAEAFSRAARHAQGPERAEALLAEAGARLRLADGVQAASDLVGILDTLSLDPDQQESLRLAKADLLRRRAS